MGRDVSQGAARAKNMTAIVIIATLGLAGCDMNSASEQSAPRSIANQSSSFILKVDAPQSSFAPALVPEDSFRAREIPSGLYDQTQGLLKELNAREAPDQSIIIDLPADILFDFDKSDLRPDAYPALEKAALLLAGYPKAPLAIYGHTDAKGEDSYNDPLSLRRAQAVASWINGKSGRSADVQGFGEHKPVAPNAKPDGSDDPDGRQKNRRVEVIIKPLTPTATAITGHTTSGPTAASESSFTSVPRAE